jgi:hypothetical protein
MMHRSLIIFALAFLAAAVSLTSTQTFADPKEPGDSKTSRQHVTTPPDQPIAKPRQATSCAQFGAGFVRVPGSDSCVRLGGGVDVGVGSSR